MPSLSLRRARPEDEKDVSALSAHIWEGEDYVPHVFESWVADEQGQFTLAYLDERLVGFGKLSLVAPGQWWLEGLRVHPEHREQGIARQLHLHAVALSDQVGPGVLRFATSSHNVAVHRLAEETGFHLVAGFLRADAAAAPGSTGEGRLVPAAAADLPALGQWLENSPRLAAAGGLYEERWTWLELLPALPGLHAQGRVYWWLEGGGQRRGLAIISQSSQEKAQANYLDAPAASLPALGRALCALAFEAGKQGLRARPVEVEGMRQALEAAGWQVEPESGMWVFERPLAAEA